MMKSLCKYLLALVILISFCPETDASPRSSGSGSSRSSSGSRSSGSSSRSSGGSSSRGSSSAPKTGGSSRSSGSGSSKSSGSSSGSKSSGSSSGSSGSKSSGSSGSSSSGSKSNSSSSSSGSSKSGSSSGWGSSNKATPPKVQRSATDIAAHEAAKKNGTAFKSRDDAMKDFRTKHEKNYSTNFAKEPAKRPDYIPQTYREGNNTYNIVYNQNHGGYGYFNPSGGWVAYSVMRDMAMLSLLMDRNHYYVETPVASGDVVVAQDSDMNPVVLVFIILAGVGVIAAIIIIGSRS